MAGMMPTSARPAFRSSAHCDGTANERWYTAVRGPSVKPQTSGAVFRNSTMEMRSLPIFANASTRLTIAQRVRRPNARGKEGQARSHQTHSFRRVQRAQGTKTHSKIFEQDSASERRPKIRSFGLKR